MFALIELLVSLKLLKEHIVVGGNPTNVGIVLVRPFLSAPTHHDTTKLGVGEGQAFARHQALISKAILELDRTVQPAQVYHKEEDCAAVPHLCVRQELGLNNFVCAFCKNSHQKLVLANG